ncbi:hypothetical protein GIB67_005405, partial [Kingdonia uniflora]
FPMMSKSRKLHQLITEKETKENQEDEEEEVEEESLNISFEEFPGGSETFEIAAKFCYGVKIDISSSNVVLLRCAAEFLDMTEEYSEDNLISKAEIFLNQSVFKKLKESVRALKSCEVVMSLAESLNIPQRCIDSIVSRAASTDPSLLGWPVNDRPGENQILWNGIETGKRRNVGSRSINNNNGSWFEDLAQLSLPLYKRVISAMKSQDLGPEIIESSLISYAKKSIPGLSRSSRKHSAAASSIASETEQRELLETIINNLPLEKSEKSSTRHLFGLLRTAIMLSASESSRRTLERKIASQLEQATLDDLLIPSYSYLIETLYDVNCVERIFGYFLEDLEERSAIEMEGEGEGEVEDNAGGGGRSAEMARLLVVGKLIDGYLAEIASDTNLKMDNFCDIAVTLPDQARLYDDGLYRAVDVYLKAHPWLSEEEREKICQVMDCQKLTLEACTHAAQNERLPLRAVVQVLFFEQLQLRQAIHGSLLTNGMVHPLPDSARPSVLQLQQREDNMGEVVAAQSNNTWTAAIRENQVLRLDMDSMTSRVQELERECSTMKKVIEKIEKLGPQGEEIGRGWRSSLTKKFGCKFKTQVCDSHERTVVDGRKGRHQRQISH